MARPQAHYYPYYTEGTLGFDPSVERYEYNPDKVKELLTEAGYPDGLDLELLVIAREPEATIGEFAQQMWNAVGINTELKLLERVAWGELLQSTQDFEATFWRGQLWPSVDPEFARPVLGCGATSNWSFFCDQEIEDALNEGLTTSDPVERGEIYSRIVASRPRKSVRFRRLSDPPVSLPIARRSTGYRTISRTRTWGISGWHDADPYGRGRNRRRSPWESICCVDWSISCQCCS